MARDAGDQCFLVGTHISIVGRDATDLRGVKSICQEESQCEVLEVTVRLGYSWRHCRILLPSVPAVAKAETIAEISAAARAIRCLCARAATT